MNQNYIDRLNREFISVFIIKNQKRSYPIEMLYSHEYPALFFLDENELFICDPISGNITPTLIRKELNKCGF